LSTLLPSLSFLPCFILQPLSVYLAS
jgi:hypothetical protein